MLEQLLQDLRSPSDAVREEALCTARALPPERMLRLVALEAERHRRKYYRLEAISASLYAAVFLGLFAAWSIEEAFIALLAGCALACPIFWLVDRIGARPTPALHSLIALIEEKQDPRYVASALILIHEGAYVEAQSSLHAILKRLLPYVEPRHAARWTRAQKEALLTPLKTSLADVPLTLCVLRTLEQIGGEESIPAVQKLASTSILCWRHRLISRAAQECLPYLFLRANQHRRSQSLLRPAGLDDGLQEEILLRPVEEAAGTRPEQMLRSVHGQPER